MGRTWSWLGRVVAPAVVAALACACGVAPSGEPVGTRVAAKTAGSAPGLCKPSLPFPSTGSLPMSIATADFNADGHADFAVASTGSSTLTILLGNGDGTFAPSTADDDMADTVVAGDFNGDGAIDLVVSRGPNEILLGKGDGTFGPPISIPSPPDPAVATNLVAVDFDGNGTLDLLYTAAGYRFCVQLGHGDGTFAEPIVHDSGGPPTRPAVGDLNGDGILDVVVPGDPGFAVFLGKGGGALERRSMQDIQRFGDVVLADFDHDGILDFAGGVETGVVLAKGKGDGTFGKRILNRSWPGYYGHVRAADFNRDGNLDLAVLRVSATESGVGILLGRGDGTFQQATTYVAGGDSDDQLYADLAIADIDSDGNLDVAVLSPAGDAVALLTGRGDGTLYAAPHWAAGGTAGGQPGGAQGVVSADLDGDGTLDLAVANRSAREAEILLGSAHGGFGAPIGYDVGESPSTILAGDLNGDGVVDLVLGGVTESGSTNVSVLLGQGKGTFAKAITTADSSIMVFWGLADLNGDGHPDLVEADSEARSSTIQVHLGKGDGTFGAAMDATVGADLATLAFGDFNGDGHVDVAASAVGGVGFLYGDGTGALAAPVGSLPIYAESLVVADLDGDGLLDVAGGDESEAFVAYGQAGGFTKVTRYQLTPCPDVHTFGLVAVDLDGDGRLDLAFNGYVANTVDVLLASGPRAFAPVVSLGAGRTNVGLAAGDFDRDGKADLAVTSKVNGDVTIVRGACVP